jgi:hypothetical protein
MQSTYDIDKRRLLSSLSHGSLFFSVLIASVGIPIAVLLVSDDPVVKGNAKEALNFHFNVWLLGGIVAISGALWWTIVLLPIALIGGLILLLSWVMPIFAILKCLREPDQVYRYPFILHILR